VVAIAFYYWAKHTKVEPTKSVLANLVADAVIIGVSLTLINGVSEYTKDKRYRPARKRAIQKVKNEFFQVAGQTHIRFLPQEDFVQEFSKTNLNGNKQTRHSVSSERKQTALKVNINELLKNMYVNAKVYLPSVDYSELDSSQAQAFLKFIKDLMKELDAILEKFDFALTPEQRTKIINFQEQLESLSYTSLRLLSLAINPQKNMKLSTGQQSDLKNKVDRFIELVDKVNNDLD
jgi:hypothetical protein